MYAMLLLCTGTYKLQLNASRVCVGVAAPFR